MCLDLKSKPTIKEDFIGYKIPGFKMVKDAWFVVTAVGVKKVLSFGKPKKTSSSLLITKNKKRANKTYSLICSAYHRGVCDIKAKLTNI